VERRNERNEMKWMYKSDRTKEESVKTGMQTTKKELLIRVVLVANARNGGRNNRLEQPNKVNDRERPLFAFDVK
jgi:hypothetical protein